MTPRRVVTKLPTQTRAKSAAEDTLSVLKQRGWITESSGRPRAVCLVAADDTPALQQISSHARARVTPLLPYSGGRMRSIMLLQGIRCLSRNFRPNSRSKLFCLIVSTITVILSSTVSYS
jgi:hypothetical protein